MKTHSPRSGFRRWTNLQRADGPHAGLDFRGSLAGCGALGAPEVSGWGPSRRCQSRGTRRQRRGPGGGRSRGCCGRRGRDATTTFALLRLIREGYSYPPTPILSQYNKQQNNTNLPDVLRKPELCTPGTRCDLTKPLYLL